VSDALRFVVYGAGAVGGVIGARLHEHGHEVVLIARGDHLRALRRSGLRLESPAGASAFRIEAVASPSEIRFRDRDVVIVSVKSQDTVQALRDLAAVTPEVTIACAQNGVENERSALRLFADVYGVHVMLPAAHLEPGVVEASSAPVTGLLDVGRYPSGADETAEALAGAFAASSFDSRAVVDIGRWKHRKLVMNLGNAVEAVFEPGVARDEIGRRAAEEGEACLRAAGVPLASRDEDRARRGSLLRIPPGAERGGGSTWQSLARGAGAVEVDYLNGEIVMLGRLHGFPTPVNAALQRLANRWAAERRPPGTLDPREFEREVASR
jgi:2-dehydropantoate 2-reductase